MPEPAQKTVLFADAEAIRQFIAFMERNHAPTAPCRCHEGYDLSAPPSGEAVACEAGTDFESAMEEAIADQWADEAADLADMIADAIRPGDANYTLLVRLTRKLREHIRRA